MASSEDPASLETTFLNGRTLALPLNANSFYKYNLVGKVGCELDVFTVNFYMLWQWPIPPGEQGLSRYLETGCPNRGFIDFCVSKVWYKIHTTNKIDPIHLQILLF